MQFETIDSECVSPPDVAFHAPSVVLNENYKGMIEAAVMPDVANGVTAIELQHVFELMWSGLDGETSYGHERTVYILLGSECEDKQTSNIQWLYRSWESMEVYLDLEPWLDLTVPFYQKNPEITTGWCVEPTVGFHILDS